MEIKRSGSRPSGKGPSAPAGCNAGAVPSRKSGPGERHWHGATRTTAMTHIAVQEALNGSPVDWMEQVSDEQYPDFARA
jgi:hypothetical protein